MNGRTSLVERTKTKINELDTREVVLIGEEDVLRLDISVDYVFTMDVLYSFQNASHDHCTLLFV